jgi:hypothetical protein
MRIKQQPRLPGRGTTKSYYTHYIRSQPNRKRAFADYILPTLVECYARIFPKLSTSQDWAKVTCLFHDDHNSSLSINFKEGFFKCHSFGVKGSGEDTK